MEIPVPKDITEYNQIIKIVRSFMEYQLRIKDVENYLREYRTRLISDAVTGQIDVRDAVIPDYQMETDNSEENADTEDMESVVNGDE